MDVFESIKQRDLGALQEALRTDLGAAGARNGDGASAFAFAHYYGWREGAAAIREALPRLSPHEAIIAGDEAALREAIAGGWDPNEDSPDGFSPLGLAAFFRHEPLFDVLLPLTRDVNRRAANGQQVAALHAAAAARSLGMVEKLLRAGADPSLPQQGGFLPLHTAAQHGDAAMSGLLLLFGASPTAPDAQGLSAIEHATKAGHEWLALRLAEFAKVA